MLVCDCGGGTVVSLLIYPFVLYLLRFQDITTYIVNRTSPTLEFEELCTGIGTSVIFHHAP